MKNTHGNFSKIATLLALVITSSCGAPSAPTSQRNSLTNGGGVIIPGGSSVFTLNPSSSRVAPGATIQFLASGGVGPFSYSIVSGGGSINPSTGDFIAPNSIGVTHVRVVDAMSNVANAQVEVALTVTLSPVSRVIQVTQTLTLTASGGEAPYNFTIDSGDGNILATGRVTATFTASGRSGTTVIRATDALGNSATSRITVQSLTPLSVTVPSNSMYVNSSMTLQINGGVSPYYPVVVSGGGTMYAGGVYQSGATPSLVQIRVTDSVGQIADVSINVVYNQSTTTQNYSIGTLVDQYLGVTLDNFGPEGYPTLVFYGTGSLSPGSLGQNGTPSCFTGANVSAPCVTKALLQNINRSVPSSTIYTGSLSFVGRNGSASAEFCIEPGNNNRAFMRVLTGSGFSASVRFDQAGHRMLDGRMQTGVIFQGLDTDRSAGNVQVSLTNGRYVSGTSCAAYSSFTIEAQP